MPVKLQPEVKSIPMDSDLHRKVADELRNRKKMGWSARSNREDAWKQAEDLFSGYVHETEVDARKRAARDLSGVPQYTTITIPYSYATLMTMHTYFASVFLSRQPVLQFQGRHAESVDSEQAVETLLDYQMNVGNNLVPLYTWLMDGGKYGEGWLCQYWCKDSNMVPQTVEVPNTFMGFQIPGAAPTKKVVQMQEVVNYEGMEVFNIRPQDFYFDPTVTAANVQKGEFVGWQRVVSWNVIRKRESQGYYFNVDKIGPYTRPTPSVRTEGELTSTPLSNDVLPLLEGDRPYAVLLDEVVIELCPSEWQLAPRDGLEKWAFTMANENVVIGCQPLGLFHNQFPVDKVEYEIEGYNVSKRGMMEIIKPLNDTLDWLINTHFYNVRKALNNEWIYDPSVLSQRDVERPGPGKLVRVRPERYGSNIRDAFYQVQVADVTQNHIRDSQLIIEMMQRLTGVNDSVMGVLGTKRQTATEVRTSSSFAVNRLKTLCEYISALGFSPLASKWLATTQQLYDSEQEFRIRGSDGGPSTVKIDPTMIAGQYNYLPVDGTLPIDRMAQAQMFGNLMGQLARIPPVAQRMDWMKMLTYMAKNLMNVKNFDSFKVQVVPDQNAAAGAQAGNLVPMAQVPGAMSSQAVPPPNPASLTLQ
jgi:hypothetical protein